ncbi:T-SNARE coiled-coil-like proteiny domain-containing protein [Aphelenchoides bicaudatus]|nr:T-SNARE coiled-coil-like proteiny domain-containing protein [Aphelenchoides bicaudatus]
MFRKPKSKNVNQRRALDTDEEAETSKDAKPIETPIQPRVETKKTNVSALTFGDEEEDDAVVGPISSFGVATNTKSVHKLRKKRKEKKHHRTQEPKEEVEESSSNGRNWNEENYRLDMESTRIYKKGMRTHDDENSRHSPRQRSISPTQVVSDDEKDSRYRMKPKPSYDELNDRDTREKFSTSFSDIPDAKAVFEAKKKRELLRATGGSVQPVIPLAGQNKIENIRGSRLVREDDEFDRSDDENEMGDGRFISSKSLLIDAEQQRRTEQLEALKLEQGGSDEEDRKSVECLDDDFAINKKSRKKSKKMEYRNADSTLAEDYFSGSDEEEAERWELEQIRKAVGQRKVTKLKDEVAAIRRHNNDPNSLAYVDRIVDEDMDIEVIPQEQYHTVPSFLNSTNDFQSEVRQQKYADINQLIEKIENSVLSRQDELKTKHHQIDQYEKNIEENRESIYKLADANIQLERNFQLYQEMKFYTDNVLNCLNEKIPLINEIESAIFDLWKTRAGELKRMRVEEENRRKFERQFSRTTWSSDDEEMRRPDSYNESMASLLERSAAIFEDTANDYCDVGTIIRHLLDWFQTNPQSFRDAYVAECIPKLVGPFVRMQLFEWNPLNVQTRDLSSFDWYQAVLKIGFNNEGVDVEDPLIVGLIPDIVEKIVLPKMIKIVNELWDPVSAGETRRLLDTVDRFVQQFPCLNRDSKFFTKLLNAIRERLRPELQGDIRVPAHLQSLLIRTEPPPETRRDVYESAEDIQALLAQMMSSFFQITIFALCVGLSFGNILPNHHFQIDGELICQPSGSQKLPVNAAVEVWEADTITSDDFITSANVTDGRTFKALFEHMELGQVSPYLVILHDCNPKAIFERCYAKTVYPIVDHHEADLGETVQLKIKLLSKHYNTKIICGPAQNYPFDRRPAIHEWFQTLSQESGEESTEEANETTPAPQLDRKASRSLEHDELLI